MMGESVQTTRDVDIAEHFSSPSHAIRRVVEAEHGKDRTDHGGSVDSMLSGFAGFLPGPEVAGYCGWFDFNNAINAMKRKDGEYILFAEDDGAQKVNMFRWTPEARR